MKRLSKILCSLAAAGLLTISTLPLSACSKKDDELVLRVSNWEEYIDEGDWEDDELIEINNPYVEDSNGVLGVNTMVDDFTEWFNSTHDYNIKVEYSTFGTNEDLYNRLNLKDVYDLVCPSDYLLMQLISENKAEPYSESFFDKSVETNYYIKNVSPFIQNTFSSNTVEIRDTHETVPWSAYTAGYMWGTTGIIYNPYSDMTDEQTIRNDVSTWNVLRNDRYAKSITVKDNVRDSYFAALGILNAEELMASDITAAKRSELMNSTDPETVAKAEDILKQIKENVYCFETDSGKADMITGKVVANFQWSGDAVFIMDEADKDDTELWYSIPEECTNLWFDGWVMLKDGIGGNPKRKEAAEAFVNFLSRPDNAIRNMNFIGYTSAIAGDMIYDYINCIYGADETCTQLYDYDLSYFFGTEKTVSADASDFIFSKDGSISHGRQLFTQYPPEDVKERSVVMRDFGSDLSAINQMWINVRCLDVKDFRPAVVWSIVGIIIAGTAAILLYKFRYKIFYRK